MRCVDYMCPGRISSGWPLPPRERAEGEKGKGRPRQAGQRTAGRDKQAEGGQAARGRQAARGQGLPPSPLPAWP